METPRLLTSVSSSPQASWITCFTGSAYTSSQEAANVRTVLKPPATRLLKKCTAAVSRVNFQRHLQCSSRQGEGGLYSTAAAAVLPACVAAAYFLGSPAVASSESFAADISLRDSQIHSAPLGGYPTELSADDSQGDMRAPGLTSMSGFQNKLRLLRPQHPVRDGIQWAIIIAVVVQIQLAKRRSKQRSQALAEKLGYAADSTQDLVGSKWQIEMDIGRERGTWMPPGWAASGRRVVLPIAIELQEGGVAYPLGVGAFSPVELDKGTWSVDGDTLRFNVASTGLERGDITLEAGPLYFKTIVYTGQLSSKRGLILVKQRRNLIRLEWRIVGTFLARELPSDWKEKGLQLPPQRMKQGEVIWAPSDSMY